MNVHIMKSNGIRHLTRILVCIRFLLAFCDIPLAKRPLASRPILAVSAFPKRLPITVFEASRFSPQQRVNGMKEHPSINDSKKTAARHLRPSVQEKPPPPIHAKSSKYPFIFVDWPVWFAPS
jgi:hypothetical protein